MNNALPSNIDLIDHFFGFHEHSGPQPRNTKLDVMVSNFFGLGVIKVKAESTKYPFVKQYSLHVNDRPVVTSDRLDTFAIQSSHFMAHLLNEYARNN